MLPMNQLVLHQRGLFKKLNQSILVHQTNKWILGDGDHVYGWFDHFGKPYDQME